MSEDAMSPDELIMAAFKGGKECMIEIRKDEETIRLDRARIVMADGEADVWLAIRADKYPDRTKALRFTKAEIRRDPTRFMANTMITATTMDNSRLYSPALVPVAREKSSSKVTAKILL